MLHTGAARADFWTQHLDSDNIGGVWGEVQYLDGVLLQNQDSVGGHVPLAVVVLQDQSGWVRLRSPADSPGLNWGGGAENQGSTKRRLTFLRYISS